MNIKLLTEQHLEFLIISLKGGCTGLSEFTLVKMPHCLKLQVSTHINDIMETWSFSYNNSLIKFHVENNLEATA